MVKPNACAPVAAPRAVFPIDGTISCARAPFTTQMVEQMHRTANLETARRGEELALGVHVMPRKEVAQTNRRRLRKGKHECSSSKGCVFRTKYRGVPGSSRSDEPDEARTTRSDYSQGVPTTLTAREAEINDDPRREPLDLLFADFGLET